MGNCLNSSTSDDISLLHESQSDRASFGDGTDPRVPDQEPPPPYQRFVEWCDINHLFLNVDQTEEMVFGPRGVGDHRTVVIHHQAIAQEQAEPGIGCSSCQLTEEEQVRLAQRMGLIQHLPQGLYDGRGSDKKIRECVICMLDFVCGDPVRFLPCMHTYHQDCIDDWLMRSLTCPTCMEPVDAALLSSYQTD